MTLKQIIQEVSSSLTIPCMIQIRSAPDAHGYDDFQHSVFDAWLKWDGQTLTTEMSEHPDEQYTLESVFDEDCSVLFDGDSNMLMLLRLRPVLTDEEMVLWTQEYEDPLYAWWKRAPRPSSVYARDQEDKQRLQKLAKQTKNTLRGGAYYDARKKRFMKYSWSHKSKEPKLLRRQSNKKVRRTVTIASRSGYRKVFDYWWQLY